MSDVDAQGHVELESEEDEDSDAVIDPEELQADSEEFVVLATCVHNDHSMHMIDPRLAAAAQEDDFGGPDDADAEIDDEGDDPPDLVPMATVSSLCFPAFSPCATLLSYVMR